MLGTHPAAAKPAGSKAPSRLLVSADEWSLLLSRPKLRRGPSLIQLYNRGEDPHDLRMRRVGGKRLYRLSRVEPGASDRLAAKLRRGSRYRLWCSLPTHRGLGMEATLKIARKRR